MSMLFVYCASFLQLVAESFPVSSSGHLALFGKMWSKVLALCPQCQLSLPWTDAIFWERYVDLLHVVPLVVIAWYFYPRWRIFLLHPLRTWRHAVKLIGYAALADCVTAVLYFTRSRIPFFSVPLWIGFSATTFLLASLFFLSKNKNSSEKSCSENTSSPGFALGDRMNNNCFFSRTTFSGFIRQCSVYVDGPRLTVPRAVLLGLFQGLALLPGLSRFAATFCGARYLGFSSRGAFEVSFMLQWPLILAAVTKSSLFFMTYAGAVALTPTLFIVLGFSAVLAWLGFCCAAVLVSTERLWYCAFYVAVIALVAKFFA